MSRIEKQASKGTVKDAVIAARWRYRLQRTAHNRYAVFCDGVKITEPTTSDEAGVDLVEKVAASALQMLGIERAEDLVAEVLEGGCDLRADLVTHRAARLAGFKAVRKARAGGVAAEAAGRT
ncbi:hypothetical protein ACTTAL_12735 [Rhodobacter capsulatus]|uniref:hypothetical protein n=1 Tax=Rhodobacter capsulatus TaxID=1061 RepID=UPI0004CFAB72|nr:hypothetical protein [Rhodobacter capsulatus]